MFCPFEFTSVLYENSPSPKKPWMEISLYIVAIIQIFRCSFMLAVAVSGPESRELAGRLLPACCDVGHTRPWNSGPFSNPGCCSGNPVGSLTWWHSEVWWFVVIWSYQTVLCRERFHDALTSYLDEWVQFLGRWLNCVTEMFLTFFRPSRKFLECYFKVGCTLQIFIWQFCFLSLLCFSQSQCSAWNHKSSSHWTEFPIEIGEFCLWWLAEGIEASENEALLFLQLWVLQEDWFVIC